VRKIALIAPSLHSGGAERVLLVLAKEFLSMGFFVEIVLLKKEGRLLKNVPNRIKVVSLNAKRIRSSFFPLINYFNNNRPDSSLVFMWPITSVAILSNMFSRYNSNIVVSDHTTLSINDTRFGIFNGFLLKVSIRMTYPKAHAVIGVSKGVVSDIKSFFNSNKNTLKNTHVVYNPAAVKAVGKFNSKKYDKIWGSNLNSYKILSVGNLVEAKDYPTLLHAIALVSDDMDVRLVIMGEGDQRTYLENLIYKLNLNKIVLMPGYRDDLDKVYAVADLLVLSSKWEGFSNVIVESISQGTPVVSTDCPSGPAEILDSGRFGKLAEVGNPTDLADKIASSLKSNIKPEFLINRASIFSPKVISRKYISHLFPDFINNKKKLP